MTSMVLVEKTAMVAGPTWNDERVNLVKKTCCPTGISDNEFALFMEQCRRTGLDPLIKQAFCVPRKTKVNEQWVWTHVFQPSESGMLARAEDFPDYRGTTSGAVYAKDVIAVDPGTGVVTHSFNPAAERGALIGAWAKVVRDGRTPNVKWLLLKDYVQTDRDGKPSGQWGAKAATMIMKCAKVAALRDEFPKVFGGIYIPEELPEEGTRANAPVAPSRSTVIAEMAAVHEGEVVATSIGQAATAAAESQKLAPSPADMLRKCTALIDDAEAKGDLTALASVGAKIPTRFKDHAEELAAARLHYAAAEGRMLGKAEAA
jgi:phage recombination protein Bet